MTLLQMMKQHPQAAQVDLDALVACIKECSTCEAACVSCADACLSEEGLQDLVDCVRVNLDCADLCGVTVRLLSRHTRGESRVLQDALPACEHCAVCAEEWGRTPREDFSGGPVLGMSPRMSASIPMLRRCGRTWRSRFS